MRKIKKSLAVFLSALMLISCIPIFASAATAMSKANCTLLEAPKLSYNGGEATSELTVPYGTTRADITIVGGKIAYNGTEIDGFFSWASSATGSPSTTVLSVGNVSSALYFHPTDTTNYSRGRWSSTTSSPIEGWPSITVNGLDATLVEAPTVSGDLLRGNALSTLTLSGGKVTDADGNDVTANGTWSFVSKSTMPAESGNQEVQWKATGYNTLTTTVYVNVKSIKTTLIEGPVPKNTRTNAFLLSASEIYIKDGSGKVLDEDGNDVTANGTWTPINLPKNTIVMKDTEIDVRWTAAGYDPVEAKMTVLVGSQTCDNITISKMPSWNIPNTTYTYAPDQTFADIASVIPGELLDSSGNVIEGTWSFYRNGSQGIDLSKTVAYTGKSILIITFVPTDGSYELTGSNAFPGTNTSVTGNKANFDIIDGFEIVLNYGAWFDGSLNKSSELYYSTVGTVPEEAGIESISWSRDVFDPQKADYGSVTMVEVTIKPTNGRYNTLKFTVPVKIQPYTISGVFTANNGESAGSYGATNSFTAEKKNQGLIAINFNWTQIRAKGSVSIDAYNENNEYHITTVTPDENGLFYYHEMWQAPEDGSYTFTFTYTPSDEDTCIMINNVAKTGDPIVVEMHQMYTYKIVVGDQVLEGQTYDGTYINWSYNAIAGTGVELEDFDHWEATDANGNVVTIDTLDIYDLKPSMCMPKHDVIITAKGAVEEADSSTFGMIKSFFTKLMDWFRSFFEMLFGYFIPTMESL